MKWVTGFILILALFLPSLYLTAQDTSADIANISFLESQLDHYSSQRVELEVLLNDTETLILSPRLPGGYNAEAVAGLRFTLPPETLREKIGAAVLDYCLEFGVKPDSQEAINFGDALYAQLRLLDHQNRRSLRELLIRTKVREEHYRQRVIQLRNERETRETPAADSRREASLTGIWKYSSGNEIRFIKTAGNRWEGYYVSVASALHKERGWRPGNLVYRNVRYDSARGIYTSEFHDRTSDPDNHHWEQRNFRIEQNTIIGISHPETASRISDESNPRGI